MKRLATGIALGATLALAGCSGFTSSNSSDYTPPSYSDHASVVSEHPSQDADTTTHPDTPKPAAPTTNARGNIEKQIGEQGTIQVTATKAVVFTFTINAITPGYKCTGSYPEPSQNGQFLAIDMTVTAGPGASEVGGSVDISAYDFQIIGLDGVVESNTDSIATYGCVADSHEFPTQGVSQGTTGHGIVVLDTKNASGYLVFKPAYMSDGGFEYKF